MVSVKPEQCLEESTVSVRHTPNSDQNLSIPLSEKIKQMIQDTVSDLYDLENFYNISISRTRIQRLGEYVVRRRNQHILDFRSEWEDLDQQGRVDWQLLRSFLSQRQQEFQREWDQLEALSPLLGTWADQLVELCELRQKVGPVDGKTAAGALSMALQEISDLKCDILSAKLRHKVDRFLASRAVQIIEELRGHLNEWFKFYKDYDPIFTWWVTAPHGAVLLAMQELAGLVNKHLVRVNPGDKDAIVGQPSGRENILADLRNEIIVYSPEQIIKIGEREYKWCEKEMIKASKEMGYGRDWRKALEHVKNLYVEPGKQPYLVHELAQEAVDYVTKYDMVTIPEIANETWRTFMMSPERQKANPFFLGGDSIIISYPTSTMSHEDKLMIMRGNSRPFSRSTVFHELLPGHHLQFYYMDRYRTYRRPFMTPFWTEGWAFYWELILWDRGFPKTPEDKIGMLFWRMHRCARIIFSLKFHLGQMTPQECIDFLVEKVGHERATAEGEVRRSFNGDYSPLYQAGYMLGALQLYALRRELVSSYKMTEKEFHDRILKENNMPIELLRALLKAEKLTPLSGPSWKFYGDIEE